MPILIDDIKLLKSAVMADTPDGGGAMTGVAVIDGQSNNLFPDTSEVDRAIGRINIRKVFGVAHTTDTDTLLGAHSIITAAPADPLVHCVLMACPEWGSERSQMRETIERYLVKGPRLPQRLNGTHYRGSLQLSFYSFVPTKFPEGGDAIVLLNPNGDEQYLRILRTAVSTQQIAVIENNATIVLQVEVALCDIGQELIFDFAGPPTQRTIDASQFAQSFATTPAAGAKFYGIKPLGAAAALGDYSVLLSGGIYTPLVPAATIESPIIDTYPLTQRQTLSRTAQSSVSLASVNGLLGPGTILTLPTAIEPGSLALLHGTTPFADDASGVLKQGSTVVGAVDYLGSTITLALSAPSYGQNTVAVTYKPATRASAATHSDALTITTANQGRSFTFAFEPPPAPATFGLSYLAQGRWYELQDDGNGKLAGADSTYGIGTVNYATGSVGFTLGAIPDVGGAIIFQWGDASVAKPLSITGTPPPTRLAAIFDTLPLQLGSASLQLLWQRGSVSYSAVADASGVLSGDATGNLGTIYRAVAGAGTALNRLTFSPAVFPDGPITANWSNNALVRYDITNNGGGSYTLGAPPQPRSVSLTVLTLAQSGLEFAASIDVVDNGLGVLMSGDQAVGTLNYTTGAVMLAASLALRATEFVVETYAAAGSPQSYSRRVVRNAHTVFLANASVASIGFKTAASGTPQTATLTTANWQLELPVPKGLTLPTSGPLFSLGGEVYTAQAGVLKKGWSVLTGQPLAANAGAVATSGLVTVTALPSNGQNTLVCVNAPINATEGLLVGQGVFRVTTAPIKTGIFQLQAGALVGLANDAGVISGGGFAGTVDYQRGIVRWRRAGAVQQTSYTLGQWTSFSLVPAEALSYNAVFLQYLPLDQALLGLNTARLPLDGRVPIYRPGDLVVLHNTQSLVLPNPLVKGTAYTLGRQRVANVLVKTATGQKVDAALYATALNAGNITFPIASNLTGLAQPFTVEHRIEDMLVTTEADISGRIKFKSAITHSFPSTTSFASGVLVATSAQGGGDVFGRVSKVFDQASWTGAWSDELIGNDTLASYNHIDFPITTTNRGAVKERWALIFTSNTAFRIVGQKYGQVGIGNTNTPTAPNNTATNTPFFTVPEFGWGGGWVAGNVLRLNTDACGTAIGVVRTVLQGPDTLQSDQFTLAFRGDVNA